MKRFTPTEADIPSRPPDAETTSYEGWHRANGHVQLIAQSRDRMKRIGFEMGGSAISSNPHQALSCFLRELEEGKMPR